MTVFASKQEQPPLPAFDDDVRAHSSASFLSRIKDSRVAIERVWPEIDGGRFAVKRAVGDALTVDADIYCDGHERIAAALLLRREGEGDWQEAPMRILDNDRWRGEVVLRDNARYRYTVIAWRDLFLSWRDEVGKKHGAGLAIDLELEEGRLLVEKALHGERGSPADRQALRLLLEENSTCSGASKLGWLKSRETGEHMARVAPRTDLTRYDRQLELWVDRRRAAFSAWYEMFPRSQSGDAGWHGTFADVVARLPYVRDLGFDVLYFTPIHPIGRINRKGRNNSLQAEAGDVGSPYAIGSVEGGHDAIHPQLGTLADFERLVSEARAHDLEIALDFAIQCSPDHPWIEEHPEWFDWRPDGTIRFAENPPKKYEDIVNVHFYREAFPGIWYALRDIVLFWSERGVRIFRVDNPHTKPFPFWEWLIHEVHTRFPDVIFLSEAFTRPKPMMRLAKLGYTQSYTYFTWRNTKHELTEYMIELTRSDSREYFRPNFFVNTPDINPFYLQTSGRSGFQVRLINRLRRKHPALQQFQNLNFYNAWNEQILYYGKFTADKQDFVLVAVNLDPHNPQGCHFEVPLWEFGLPDEASIDVEDLVTGNRFTWTGKIQHMLLEPSLRPYAIWRLSKRQEGA
jgi:starch synthase (maltosyl-transferring)